MGIVAFSIIHNGIDLGRDAPIRVSGIMTAMAQNDPVVLVVVILSSYQPRQTKPHSQEEEEQEPVVATQGGHLSGGLVSAPHMTLPLSSAALRQSLHQP